MKKIFNAAFYIFFALVFYHSNAFGQGMDVYFDDISVTPSYTNHTAEYSISFTVGNGENSAVESGDSIDVVLPSETYLPESISSSNVTVNDVQVSDVQVLGNTIRVTLNNSILKKESGTIKISSSAGIRNPSVGYPKTEQFRNRLF